MHREAEGAPGLEHQAQKKVVWRRSDFGGEKLAVEKHSLYLTLEGSFSTVSIEAVFCRCILELMLQQAFRKISHLFADMCGEFVGFNRERAQGGKEDLAARRLTAKVLEKLRYLKRILSGGGSFLLLESMRIP